ncbi:hypothetical protein RFI_24324 [Reticulomyxa filosa]|uniref:Uncharacterized protein n=1 Tax=Reticulomyxa filosa TaxID=46433 RepID=X6MHA5_RETFI|nr:hypothetical protein RFI_24324 [Reticulomyxa filosa]|eukprot:ETO13051.1 hypothetical protein RFI_24324 [Reticulomyxa filosa]
MHLKNFINEHYPDFVQCSRQLHSIDQDMSDIAKVLKGVQNVFELQQAIQFDLSLPTNLQKYKKIDKNTDISGNKSETSSTILTDTGLQDVDNETILEHLEMSPWHILEDINMLICEQKWAESIALLLVLESDISRPKTYQREIHPKHVKTIEQQISQKVDRRRLTTFLLQLGEAYYNRGINTYFQVCGTDIYAAIRRIRFRGDLKHYVFDLTKVVCGNISEIAIEYLSILKESIVLKKKDFDLHKFIRCSRAQSFAIDNSEFAEYTQIICEEKIKEDKQQETNKDNVLQQQIYHNVTSALILFTFDQIKQYMQYFSTHIFSSRVPFPKMVDCLQLCFTGFQKLETIGIDVCMHLIHHLQSAMKNILRENQNKKVEKMAKVIALDNWKSKIVVFNQTNKSGINHTVALNGLKKENTLENSPFILLPNDGISIGITKAPS